jgi:hypothetical protein
VSLGNGASARAQGALAPVGRRSRRVPVERRRRVHYQAGRLYDLEPGERAYYAAQPVWFVILTDMSLVAAVVAAIAILLRRRAAVQLHYGR